MLSIRDDGSTDGTLALARKLADEDARLRVIENQDGRTGSAATNFALLLQHAYESGVEYVFCCDQDDVWAPDKVSSMLSEMKRIERDSPGPVLLHHDLEVVDEELRPIADSYWKMMQIRPGTEQFPGRLLSRNEVTGCATLCNRALLELALPVPGTAIMHDWWLALCAAWFGSLRHLDRKLVRYRQHEGNVIGARSFWQGIRPGRSAIGRWQIGNLELLATLDQAGAFLERFEHRLDPEAKEAVAAYAYLLSRGPICRPGQVKRAGAWRGHWVLDAALFARLLLMKRRN